MRKNKESHRRDGFTLIELSIVLVVIGLIVGGVLVGQNLIAAASVRAQITQIEKFNTAVNTFRSKYDNYLPGDIPPTEASKFGLATRTGQAGQGDGNGLIDGPGGAGDLTQGGGETGLFWVDLSTAYLIDGSFTSATATSTPTMTSTTVGLYMPAAKLGNGNYLYAYDDGKANNWFGFSGVSSANSGQLTSTPNITVLQAAQIDGKVDDGFPASGNVQAVYLVGGVASSSCQANSNLQPIHNPSPCQPTSVDSVEVISLATNDSPAASGNGDCYDSTTQAGSYAVNIDGGADVNCALSFRFQ